MLARAYLTACFLLGIFGGPALAQSVQVVQDCSGIVANVGPGNRLYADQGGRLCIGTSSLRSAGTNRSATVGTAAITLMPANPARTGWKIKNDSVGDLWINFDGAATATPGGGNIKVAAGSYLASEPGFVETGAMSAIGSAAGLAITAREH